MCADMHRETQMADNVSDPDAHKAQTHQSNLTIISIIANIWNAYHVPGTELGTIHMLPHLILQTSTYNLGGK